MKIKLFLTCCFAGLILMSSCSKDDEFYSCDPEVDKWAKENLEELQAFTRVQWVDIQDTDYKMAVYRVFTPEQERLFWIHKIEKVLMLDWDDAERSHINRLLDFVKDTNIFISKDNMDEFELFVYRWTEYALESLKWNKVQVYAICAAGEDLIDTAGNLNITNHSFARMKTRSESGSGSSKKCGCSQSSDYCDIFSEVPVVKCRDWKDCDKSGKGCGIFLQFACDGICRGNV